MEEEAPRRSMLASPSPQTEALRRRQTTHRLADLEILQTLPVLAQVVVQLGGRLQAAGTTQASRANVSLRTRVSLAKQDGETREARRRTDGVSWMQKEMT